MHMRRFLALAACSSFFLIACSNQQASVTPPAEEEGTEAPAAVEGTDGGTDDGAVVEVEVGTEAEATAE